MAVATRKLVVAVASGNGDSNIDSNGNHGSHSSHGGSSRSHPPMRRGEGFGAGAGASSWWWWWWRRLLAVPFVVGAACLVLRREVRRLRPELFSLAATSSTSSASHQQGGGPSSAATTTIIPGMDFWWMAALRANPDASVSLGFESPRTLVFSNDIARVWIDVGVNKKSDFLVNLDEPTGSDLFVIGYEPSAVWKPCPHNRCAVLWAAATPTHSVIEVNVQDGADLCNSLLKPNTDTTSQLWRGCVTQKTDATTGKPVTVQAPGVPLSEVVARIPEDVQIEYVKIDAQGYDLEVMKGALEASSRLQVVSLEAMDVDDPSKLLYQGQPTLSDIQHILRDAGWTFVKSVSNHGARGEVNAFFVHDDQYASKVDHLADVLMGNKEGKGEE